MKNKPRTETKIQALRQKAEELLQKQSSQSIHDQSEADMLRLIHELQVHQIELELQNEELILAKEQAVAATERYTEIYDFAPSGYFNLSQKGTITELNLSAAKMLGKERSLIVNSNLDSYLSNDSRLVFKRFLLDVFYNKKEESCEVELAAANHVPMFLQLSGIITENLDQCRVTALDVSSRKQAENAAAAVSLKYQSLLHTATEGIHVLDMNGNVVEANEAFCTMLGYTRSELLNLNVADWDLSLAKAEVAANIKKLMAQPASFETHHWSKDGTCRDVEINTTAVTLDGQAYLYAAVRDITDRKRTETALIDNEARFRILTDTAPVLVWQTGTDTMCNFVNKPWLDYTGRTLEQEMGNGWFDCVHPEDLQHCLNIYLNSFAEQGSFSMEFRLKSAYDEYRWFLDNGIPRFTSDGTFIGYIGTLADITEIKNAKKALLDSNWRISNIIDSTHVGTWEWNVQTGEAIFNQEWAKMIGYTLKQLSPVSIKTWIDCMHPDDLKFANQLLTLHFEGQLPYFDCEFRMKHKDGHWVWIYTRGQVISFTSDNKPLMMFGTHTDISDRRLAAEKLETSESKYRNVFSTGRDALFLIDKETASIIEVNNAACALYGYTCKEMLGLKNTDMSAEVEKAKIATGEFHARIELQYHKKKDGTVFPVDISSTILELEDRKVILASIRDISLRKQAEDAVRESLGRLIKISSRIPGLVYQYRLRPDGSSCFPYSSEAINEIYRVAPEEVCEDASKVFAVLHPDDVGDIITSIRTSASDLSPWQQEYRVKFADGTVRSLYGNALPQLEEDGSVLWHGYISDVTELKKSEQELELINIHLRNVIAEKDKFFSVIAHDLRGPFNGFLGLTELLVNEVSTLTVDEIQKMADVMKKSATNLFGLLGNLLDWSRMQRGMISFSPETIVLLPKITELLKLTAETAFKKDITVSCHIPDDLVVFADDTMLGGIIRNLISNAIKFTLRGGSIQVKAKYTERGTTEISIHDTGIGMNQNLIDDLFRLDCSISRKGTEGEASTGLGLNICKDFVEKHGGEITVESEEGKGSTFRFILPGIQEIK